MMKLYVQEPGGFYRPATTVEVRAAAIRSLRRLEGRRITSPTDAAEYLQIHLGPRANEAFGMVMVDAQNRVLKCQELFQGSTCATAVYPGAVVRAALAVDHCVGVVLFHNHPSGWPDPSEADKRLTRNLRDALALVEVKVLDHLIIAGDKVSSFAQRGLL